MNAEQLEEGKVLLEDITQCGRALSTWQEIKERHHWNAAIMRNRLGPEAGWLEEGDIRNVADVMVKALSRKHQELIDKFAAL